MIAPRVPSTPGDDPKHNKPHILITNDDGIRAPGLLAIARELRSRGFPIRVVAPSANQSGKSHSITLDHSVISDVYTLPGEDLAGVMAVEVEGTPADCVKLCLTALYKDWKPDMVVSGINKGANVGRSVSYSGTVGAALESVLCGIPAVAISIEVNDWFAPPEKTHYSTAAYFGAEVIIAALSTGLPVGTLLNVNLPDAPRDKIKGLKLTKHGKSSFDEGFKEYTKPGDSKRSWKIRGHFTVTDVDPDMDAVAVANGFVSVTPLGTGQHSDDAAAVVANYGRLPLFQPSAPSGP
jgi:5'-nucleotidase